MSVAEIYYGEGTGPHQQREGWVQGAMWEESGASSPEPAPGAVTQSALLLPEGVVRTRVPSVLGSSETQRPGFVPGLVT